MSNGNFKVRCLKSDRPWYTTGKIYEFKSGIITDDDGECKVQIFNNIEEWKMYCSGCEWELVTEQSHEYISIIRKKNRVVATITKGEDKFTQYVRLSDANNDYKTAVKMVVDRLMERWNGFEVEEIEAVDKTDLKAEGFKVGDRVELVENHETANIGEQGTILFIFDDGVITVEFDNDVKGHSGMGFNNGVSGKTGHCWHCSPSELKIIQPTIKEVHRPAKVGEWIKVIHSDFITVSVGEIKKVKKIFHKDAIGIEGSTPSTADNDGLWVFFHSEYVVLENYQPKEHKPMPSKDDVKPCNKVSRRAEVGEWVEIIKNVEEDKYKVGDILHIVPTIRSMPYPYYKDESGCYLYDDEYLVLENFNPNNLPSTEKPDISILDNFTFEEIAKYLFKNKVGDGK